MSASISIIRGRHLDLVRLFGGLWFLLLAVCVVMGLRVKIDAATSISAVWPSVLSSFYVILALMVMTRPPAKAQATRLLPKIAAFVGTYMPWTIIFCRHTDYTSLNLLSSAFVLTGTLLMLFAIWHLGKSFSLVPQARDVVQSGPYGVIRHPLYFAEAVSVLGAVLQFLSPTAVLIFVAFISVQVCRIQYEESLLRQTLPTYSSYAASRWRLIPYVW